MRQVLALACACALLLISVSAECHDGSCLGSEIISDVASHSRQLQQGWGGAVTCGSQPITVAYAGTAKPDISSLASDLESTLTNAAIGTHASFKVIIDEKSVGYASLTEPDSCLRTLTTVRGGLVIYDDGNIPDLSALSTIRTVNGPFVIYGNYNASLKNLAGLEGIRSVAHLNLAHTKLSNLAGLTGLSVINGDLIAWDNANLTNLQGMGAVSQLYGKLWMDSNPRLQDLTGLEALASTSDDTVFVDCPLLRSLDGLGSLQTIGRDLVLRNLRSLTSTAALRNLTSVGQSIILMQMPNLQDIKALKNIQAVNGDIQLYLLPKSFMGPRYHSLDQPADCEAQPGCRGHGPDQEPAGTEQCAVCGVAAVCVLQ